MKLFHCRACGDIRNLAADWRECSCRKVRAKYKEDLRDFEIEGHGLIICFDNYTFMASKKKYDETCLGSWIRCWLYPTPTNIEKENVSAKRMVQLYLDAFFGIIVKKRPEWMIRLGIWFIGAKNER